MRQPGNEQVRQIFDTMSPRYDTQMGRFERFFLRGARDWAVAQAHGRVLEIAVGTGLNLPRYGPDVTRITGVDLSDGMLDIARRRITELHLDRAEVRRGDAQRLDLPDASVDTVLSTFTFCTIPDPLQASREALRVLAPGGRFVLAEHGPVTSRVGRMLMRTVEPLFIRFGADHLTREPQPYLEQAGFAVDTVQRRGRGGMAFCVVARKPAG
ncbi:methyltransferase domain-containing protein [Rhodococcus triatomae]|uniref:Ubiquinone/menaquinone biosynthesis C-methylase UbiE n=1 Tax=Rhodococcus triatomae TaxID=300028 RepID=A0A1G7ZNP5_9NOCA|nr:methyltransferase domain-containing protein [Rhodococcus triatomae]QNG17995.1 methyltransferase domain-containing protein [Rhodococcus triatomae]QNG22337.1 methyltransferase domain-containing protein [Rhodococcus triatomae]SDH10308.1 Ubiquinone/menaquinone biosynthesis C-methylase UbiE [Rhodococcus triatomae]